MIFKHILETTFCRIEPPHQGHLGGRVHRMQDEHAALKVQALENMRQGTQAQQQRKDDRKTKILHFCKNEGHTTGQVMRKLNCSKSCVNNLLSELMVEGKLSRHKAVLSRYFQYKAL